MPRIYVRRPIIDRVFDHVIDVNGHWIWTGAQTTGGYGHIGEGGHDGRMVAVHRVTWEFFRGPIPPGLVLDHLDNCLNTLCCNPFMCLEPVTQAVNRERQTQRINRTACDEGHIYTPETTWMTDDGARQCRTCHAARERAARARRRQAKQDLFAEVCKGGHVRTDGNTFRTGQGGLGCRDCIKEVQQARRHREALLSGSGSPPS